MPTVSHASLTADADLHEPKGAAAAAANTVYLADGAGSGSFQNILTALTIPTFSENTYNPELSDSSSTVTAAGGSYTSRAGRYIKVADWVFVLIQINVASIGSLTAGSQARLSLPLTAETLSGSSSTDIVGGLIRVRNTNVDSGVMSGIIIDNEFRLYYPANDSVTVSDITTGSVHSFMGFYKAAS